MLHISKAGLGGCGQSMFFIRNNILHLPFNFFGEEMFPDITIRLYTNRATAADAMIRVNEEFHGRSKFFLDNIPETVYFFMRFPNIQEPGNGHMTINMQHISEFNHAQIMDINPVGKPAFIYEINYF